MLEGCYSLEDICIMYNQLKYKECHKPARNVQRF